MKRFPLIVGKLGIGMMVAGILAAALSLITPTSGFPIAPLLLVGAFVYLAGSVMAVGAFDYVRGSKLFLGIRIARILFAVIVVYAVIRGPQ